jgi:hypothetical protein
VLDLLWETAGNEKVVGALGLLIAQDALGMCLQPMMVTLISCPEPPVDG